MVMRAGEALVAGGPLGMAAEPEIVIGELDAVRQGDIPKHKADGLGIIVSV